MSYENAIRWQKTHPAGIPLTPIMSTHSGFWPSRAWLDNDWWPYVEFCKANGFAEPPLDQEAFYNLGLGSAGWLNVKEHFVEIASRKQGSVYQKRLPCF